jgi:hypothetical protein
LSAFFNAATQLFGSEQAGISAEDWSHELIEIDGLPGSIREWRLIPITNVVVAGLSIVQLEHDFDQTEHAVKSVGHDKTLGTQRCPL